MHARITSDCGAWRLHEAFLRHRYRTAAASRASRHRATRTTTHRDLSDRSDRALPVTCSIPMAADFREEPSYGPRIAQDVDLGARCDSLHGVEDPRPPAAPVAPEPAPEVGTFARPADGSPGAPEQWEVEQDDRVRRAQTNVEHVVGAEIAISDPGRALYELVLCGRPRIGRHGLQAAVPEDVVQVHDRETGEYAQLVCESRLARAAPTEDDDALHLKMVARDLVGLSKRHHSAEMIHVPRPGHRGPAQRRRAALAVRS